MVLGGQAQVLRLPAILGDNMVLQRNAPVPVWGFTAPGRVVTVRFRGQSKQVTANALGRWEVLFRDLKPADGAEMVISDGVTERTLRNILVGDVWLCSGQSNMEWPVELADNAETEIRNANWDQIRLFTVEKNANSLWEGDVQGRWVICTPETVRRFSAVGFFFGRALTQSEGAPIGLINSSWGGTPAEAWTPAQDLRNEPETRPMIEQFDKAVQAIREAEPEMVQRMQDLGSSRVADPGDSGSPKGWNLADFDDSAWRTAKMPQLWQQLDGMQINGVVWWRRSIDLSPAQAQGSAVLELGAIDDNDVTWVNGVRVGGIGPETTGAYAKKRVYSLPAGTLKPGRNVIAVRVHDEIGGGGFSGAESELVLKTSAGNLPLAGPWRYEVELAVPVPPTLSVSPWNPNAPTTLYNGMIRPLVPFRLKGAIWYQGESNVGRARQYSRLFPAMIRAWRREFGGDFAFLFVQLANFQARRSEPGESAWAELREAQDAALGLPNTGRAVILDIGDADDIHPRNKQDVGARLAMAARLLLHPGSQPAGSSPDFVRLQRGSGSVRVILRHAAGLRTTDGRDPVGFAVKSAGGEWVWAEAKIVGEAVELRHPEGAEITEVRYAWADNPAVNLVNGLGLPAAPFRTDRPRN